jgi:cytoskeletal protein CcmA (bactofilin family)
LIGQLYIEGDLRVGGVVEGELEATGDVEIDDMANVKASLAGRDVTVRGHLVGAVVARKRLIVAKSGSVIGDVRVQRLAIADGATFSGKVSMGAGADAPVKATPSAPVVPEPEVKIAAKAAAPAVPAPIIAAPIIAAPIIAAPITPPPSVQAPPVSKDGKGKAVTAKAAPPKTAPQKAAPPKAAAPKAPPPKGKQKRR